MKYATNPILSRAVLETLEPRALFSASALTSAGQLTLQGQAGQDNTLQVSLDPAGSTLLASLNGATYSYPLSSVKSLVLLGSNGNDKLLVAPGLNLPAYLDGGAGNDSLQGSDANDTLLGGAGDDTLDGTSGNDLLRGGDGNDSLTGGPGDDSLFGELGNDTLVSTSGSDLLDGGDGTNTLDGLTATAAPAPGATPKLTGTPFGTPGSWNFSGNTLAKAFDGDPATAFDAPNSQANLGLDLGSPSVISSIRFFPRYGLAWRMTGGKFQASNDNSTWTDLATLTSSPAEGAYTTVPVTNPTPFRYVRYLSPVGGWGNVAELEFYGPAASSAPAAPTTLSASLSGANSVSLAWTDNASNESGFKIERSADNGATWTLLATTPANTTTYTDSGLPASTTYTYRVRATNSAGDSPNSNTASATTPSISQLPGTGIGTPGSWNFTGNDLTKALDGDTSTFFDAPTDTAFVGLDLGAAKSLSSVRYAPRPGYGWRMVGGAFQGSNDNANWTTLATVTAAPPDGQYASLPLSGSYRYVRYLSPASGYGNVAEIQFFGTNAPNPSGPGSTGNNTGSSSGNTTPPPAATTPAAPTSLTATITPASAVALAWTDNATNETGYKVERSTDNGATWTLLATTPVGATTYTDSTAAASTTYAYRVRATNSAGDSPNSNTASAAVPAPVTVVTAGAPQPVISLMESSITAGMSVQVNGLNSVLNSGTCVSARYDWDFGDPAGSYNQLPGFNAAHLYSAPGTYTVKLTVTDDQGRSASTTATVTVTPDTRRTIYVDSISGNDSNDGSSPTAAVRTANRAFQLVGDNTRVLFNRGGSYPVTASLNTGYHNLLVGAYGTGNRPVLTWAGGAEQWWETISGTTNSQDVMVRDLLIDGGPNKVNGIVPRGTNYAVVDCDFRNLEISINCAGNPTGLLVQDNTQAANAGVTDYWLWLQGTDAVVLGNNIGPGGMYAIRTSGGAGSTVYRALFAHNTLANADRSNLRVQKGGYVYIADNTFTSSGVEFGPLGGGDGFTDPGWATARTSYVVFENNSVNLADGKYVRLTTGLEHAQVRNNVIEHDGNGAAIGVEGYDSAYNRTVVDATLANNTIIDNATVGMAIQVQYTENAPQISILRNVFIAPHLLDAASTGSVGLWVYDPASLKLDQGNIWNASPTEPWIGPMAWVYVQGASPTNFITPTQWATYSNVQGDLFQDVTLTGPTYQITLNGTTAGSTLTRS